MDNHQMKVDSYGRLIHVPEYPYSEPEAPEPMVAEEVWARAERVKKLEDEIERAKTHIYNLRERVKILEITPLASTWVEEELENIKNMLSERVCSSCKWGNPINDYKEIDCHYEPQDVSHTPSWWCSRWTEK